MAGGRREPRVFTIPAGTEFLPTFARALLDGDVIEGFSIAGDPLALAGATIYVPTRRAARALASEIARLLPGPSAILPRIVPLGQMENIETGLLLDPSGLDDGLSTDMPPAVSEMRRRATLTRFVLAWSRSLPGAIVSVDDDGNPLTHPDEAILVATSTVQAWSLATELAGLIDEMIIEGVPWSALDRVAPEEFDRYWRITLDFLKIAVRLWPEHLAEHGLIDHAERQARLVEAEVARLGRDDNRDPVIAIGSTGTNNATAHLLRAIARAPRGAVVLPGLDQRLDPESWEMIHGDQKAKTEGAATHPQAAMRRLLPILGVDRAAVASLREPDAMLARRAVLMSEAMRPAESTDAWRMLDQTLSAADIDVALADVAVIEASDEREEALALAIRIRETLEQPGQTVALTTPDRTLAQRVRAELARWNIDVDDSGGEPLGTTPIGALARLAASCASPASGSAELMGLLSHPLATFGRSSGEVARLVGFLDIGVFRQGVGRYDGDLAALLSAARTLAIDAHAHRALKAIDKKAWDELDSFASDISQALAPLRQAPGERPLKLWADAHRAALAAILKTSDTRPTANPEALEALQTLFDNLDEIGAAFDEPFSCDSYAAFFDMLAQETVVRGPRRAHPRVKILGLLEARLLDADVMLLGGLDETIWPPSGRTDPFLNRPMRAMLGLTPPERRIGQTAHDFVQAMGSRRVVVSRARKRDGAPTVPSRFLQRLRAVAGEQAWSACLSRGAHYVALAAAIDRPVKTILIKPPLPKPAVELRPRSLSVTRIETLRRDPYSIYAERILDLPPLSGLDVEEGPRETGTRIHDLLAKFAAQFPIGESTAGASNWLVERAREQFGDSLLDPEFRTFQWPRIESSLVRFIGWEAERRRDISRLLVEQNDSLTFALEDGSSFRLSAIADRIEFRRDGKVMLIDFKTGLPPSPKEIAAGFATQLTLEGAMVARGAFGLGVTAENIAGACYVRLLGRDPKIQHDVGKADEYAAMMVDHFDGMLVLLNQFRNPDTPYLSRPYVKFVHRFSPYDHLARVQEWSSASGPECGE